MKTYSERFKQIKKQLMEACDDRLLRLDEDDWDERIVPVAEVPEELQETALWLLKHGFHSVEEMISDMIRTLQKEIGVDIVFADDSESLVIYCVKSADGYYLPLISVVADPASTGEYWVGNSPLTTEYSEKCWLKLSEKDRKYLESIDWGDLSYEDESDIYSLGRYEVEIEIDADGIVTLHHYNG